MNDNQVDATTASRCIASTASGKPCQGFVGTGSKYCFAHDPEQRQKRKQARSAGGKARHHRRVWSDEDLRPAVSIRTTDDVLALLERAVIDELRLENSHNRNRTIASLAMASLRALEVGEFEQRLMRLEESIVTT